MGSIDTRRLRRLVTAVRLLLTVQRRSGFALVACQWTRGYPAWSRRAYTHQVGCAVLGYQGEVDGVAITTVLGCIVVDADE